MIPQIVAVLLMAWLIAMMLKDRGMLDVSLPKFPKISFLTKKENIKEKWFLPKKVIKKKNKSSAPISGKCAKCKKSVVMPYKCKFCGRIFCDEHRLPENHDCVGVSALRRGR